MLGRALWVGLAFCSRRFGGRQETTILDVDRWRLGVLEDRREQADNFAWTVPGLAIAAQAFLLTIVLRPEITSLARLLAALAGLVAAAAASHMYGKQVYLFDLYEGAIEAERQRLKLPGTQLDELRKLEFPPNTLYSQRRWATEHLWRHRIIVRQRVGIIWLIALMGFVVIDALLLVYSIVALTGNDPHWLSH